MQIKSIEAMHLRLPPGQDYRWASLLVALGDFLLAKIVSDNLNLKPAGQSALFSQEILYAS